MYGCKLNVRKVTKIQNCINLLTKQLFAVCREKKRSMKIELLDKEKNRVYTDLEFTFRFFIAVPNELVRCFHLHSCASGVRPLQVRIFVSLYISLGGV